MMNSPVFLVVGSAHLDILARSTGDESAKDKIGEVSIEIGGTACNIALSLAKLGAHTNFLTAMNSSPYSIIIAHYLEQNGIHITAESNPTLKTAAFSAHVSSNGELSTAISSMPVDQHTFNPEIIRSAMHGVDTVILDCNLSPEAMRELAVFAKENGKTVFVAGVSEEKSMRCLSLIGMMDGLFVNQREFQYLLAHGLKALGGMQDASEVLSTMLIVTDGENGVHFSSHGSKVISLPPPALEDPSSFLGMGDALLAGTVYMHIAKNTPIKSAVMAAYPLVAEIAKHPNCNSSTAGSMEKVLHEIRQNATYDRLTGALNRLSTEKCLHTEFIRAKCDSLPLSVGMIDIDLFKSVNDTWGHAAGDKVIAAVIGAIQSVVRGTDAVGRWGGEEFILIMPGAVEHVAASVMDRIRSTVQKTILEPREITVSIGCACLNGDENWEALVERADQCLYEAKHTGRNRVVTGTQLMDGMYAAGVE